MPVVRSRGGLRFEAGRGYPRLKWSDINKATIIANELQFQEEKEKTKNERTSSSKRRPPIGNAEQLGERAAAERSQRRRGILIHSDGESEESSSDNSLIYSDFRLSPESGRVRMAFTVPLTRLAASDVNNRQHQPVFQSTLQIRHTMVDRLERPGNSDGSVWKGTEKHPPSQCACNVFSDKGTDKSRLCSKHSKKSAKGAIENLQTSKQQQKKTKDNWRHCVRWPSPSPASVDIKTDCSTKEDSISPYLLSAAPHDSLTPRVEKNFSPRPTSFWRDIKAGGKGCLAAHKHRLRDATFIIYQSDLETSPSKEKRGGARKPLGDTSLIPQRGKLVSPPDKGKGSSSFLGPEMNRALFSTQHSYLPLLNESLRKPRWGLGSPPSAVSASLLEGQRSSCGSGTTPPKRTSNPPTPSQTSSQTGTPKHSSLTPSSGNAPTKGKKVLKTYLRDTGTRKSLQTRTKSVSSSSAANSPVSLHGRVLQKTASVSPAPSKPPVASHSGSLTRFGFKSSPLIASGDSTDSVNSILSDAQTTSDANSNIFDFSEDNGNVLAPPAPDLTTCSPSTQSETKDSSEIRGISPCTISQASSGVTSTLVNGKLKAQTKQLPSPQIVTVKAMNKKQSSPNGTTRSRYSSPVSRKEASPQRSPLVISKEQRSKIPQNVTKSSPPKVQRMSRDSESSSKSSNTLDSGLGSSSESDKLRTSETSPPETVGKLLVPVTVQEKKGEEEKAIELDMSDAWLKEKRQLQNVKRRSCDLDLKFREGSTYQNGVKPVIHEKPQKESFKEKRDSSITYGMARQKFAPYTRNRIGYQSSSTKGTPTSNGSARKDDSAPKGKLGDGSIVRRRVAQLEKTPAVPTVLTKSPNNNNQISLKPPRKPIARPTSIEKTPILVSPKTENTVELSRSICRRLEYSEGKGSLLDVLKDNKLENHLIELPTTAQDLLMVDSFEVKKEKCLRNLPSSGDEISVKLPTKLSLDADCEHKRIKDISECENTNKRLSEDSNGNPTTKTLAKVPENDQEALPSPPLPDSLGGKVFSPDGSETSFEIIESGSVDLSPKIEAETSIGNDGFLSRVVAGFAAPSSGPLLSAKHSQDSPSRVAPLKKCRQASDNEESTSKPHEEMPLQMGTSSDSQTPRSDCQSEPSIKSPRSVMESSAESGRSGDSNRTTSEFGDRWTVSGKCTPTLSSTRGDVDQDFLIDDEISDQPGLTFGDELEASFFGDEDLFSDELSSPSASHLLSKSERSRHCSLGTTSSIGPDDLMLDYDLEEGKQTGQPPVPTAPDSPRKSPTKEVEVKPVKSLDISIPGPRYDEEVLSPVACDILTEWSAILSDAQSSSRAASQTCVSQQTVGVSTAATSSLNAGLSSSPVNDINTHQPQSIAKESSDDCLPCSRSFPCRSRTTSASPDYCTADIKKGVNFKPPRQGAASELEGGINIDRTTLHYICQDVTTMKTLLLRLRRVLQVADTINPFDSNLKTSLYLSLGANEAACCEREEPPHSSQDVVQQNVDLKRQVVLLQQRLEEKDRTIRILQQQLAHALIQTNSLSNSTGPHLTPPSSPGCGDDASPTTKSMSNAATQTERLGFRSSPFNLATMSRTSSIEDGLGPTVSSETASGRSAPNDCSSIDPSAEEGKKSSSPEKFPSELLAPSSPKLHLIPAVSPVAGSLAS